MPSVRTLVRSEFSRVSVVGLTVLLLASCSQSKNAPLDPNQGGPNTDVNKDTDGDGVADPFEDRNENGRVDPGETDPSKIDTDGDGIPDAEEVASLACAKINDRPFDVLDVPGADSEFLIDGAVNAREALLTAEQKMPGVMVADPSTGAVAILVGKAPAAGVTSASAQRSHERQNVVNALAEVTAERGRALTTAQGFGADQVRWHVRLPTDMTVHAFVKQVAERSLGAGTLSGGLAASGAAGREMILSLLTIYRGADRVVMVLAAALDAPLSDAARIRLEEFTDGTNVARKGSFTRHVCDQTVAEVQAAADILWVIDDSGSMKDDQEAVSAAAAAMADILRSADVDYRLAVARHFSDSGADFPQRGDLQGDGFTRDLTQFQSDVVVGAKGGFEPGLETGLLALERGLPRTAPGQDKPRKLREGVATIVIHLSDERDQTVECIACGSCQEPEDRQAFCTQGDAGPTINSFVERYKAFGAVNFAIVGDLPNGCQQTGSRVDFEPGQGYVEVARETGGQFGSLCGDMRQNLEDVARASIGIASSYTLSVLPASATLKVAVGPAGQGRVIPQSGVNGFDYDAATNRIIFYGDSVPKSGDEVVIAYRRWDWQGNPDRPDGNGNPDDPNDPNDPNGTPDEACDRCEGGTECVADLDTAECVTECGEERCDAPQVCLPDYGICGDPTEPPPGGDDCGTCTNGRVCDQRIDTCVEPCEQTGCSGGETCNQTTHLCELIDL